MQYRKEIKRRKVTQRILILCEGKTEKLYLTNLKSTLPRDIQRDVNIDIFQAKKSEPTNALKEIKQKRNIAKSEKQPYKEIWMVFDDDNRKLKELFQKLTTENIYVAYSSISIEFWFILHFEQTKRHYTNQEAFMHLLQLKPDYKKTSPNLWKEFEPYYQISLKHAIWLRKQFERIDASNLSICKPFTNMDELTEKIRNYNGNL